jgi:hypothetical protein
VLRSYVAFATNASRLPKMAERETVLKELNDCTMSEVVPKELKDSPMPGVGGRGGEGDAFRARSSGATVVHDLIDISE